MLIPIGPLAAYLVSSFFVIPVARRASYPAASTAIFRGGGVAVKVVETLQEAGKIQKMKTLAEKFLTVSEQQNVTEVVQEAECATTFGEIVPMIVSRRSVKSCKPFFPCRRDDKHELHNLTIRQSPTELSI